MIKGDLKVMNEIHLDLFQNKEIKSKYTFKQSSFILFVGQKIEGGREIREGGREGGNTTPQVYKKPPY